MRPAGTLEHDPPSYSADAITRRQARQSTGLRTATPAVLVSGLTGEGLAKLFDLIDRVLPFDIVETVRFRIPLRDGAAIALLHECGKVLVGGI